MPVAFDGDWPALVAQLKLGGFAGMLAQHAQLDHHADGHFTLAVPDAHKVVAGPDYRDKLAQALSTHLGQSIRVSVTVGGNEAAVPAALQQRERQAQHADAVDAINRDPIVQQLITEFDAHVLPDSIQPRPQSA
nr:DNA polymerase III subunit gamma/tau C-terminal domain-containing protein [Chitinimonas sp. BJYL2]